MQVHPVVSRLCAPIEGTDAAHLADCLGLDPAKFRQQVNAASGDAREEAQLAAASVFDDDDRYKARTHNLHLLFADHTTDAVACNSGGAANAALRGNQATGLGMVQSQCQPLQGTATAAHQWGLVQAGSTCPSPCVASDSHTAAAMSMNFVACWPVQLKGGHPFTCFTCNAMCS